eukprot:1283666-Pleurochrysis_carterae.AAC.1
MKCMISTRLKGYEAARMYKAESDRKLAQEAKDRAEGKGVSDMETKTLISYILDAASKCTNPAEKNEIL